MKDLNIHLQFTTHTLFCGGGSGYLKSLLYVFSGCEMVYHLILQVFKYLSIHIYFLGFPQRNVDFVALLLSYRVSSSSRD